MTKRLIDYEIKDADTIWTNSNLQMQRHEFKQLKRQWVDDINNSIQQLRYQNQIDNVDYDKHYGSYQNWLQIYLWLEILKFQNQLSLNQVLQLAEHTFDYLEPIHQKILFVKLNVYFDFIDHDSHRRLDKMKKHLINNADYTEHEFQVKYKWTHRFIKADDIWGNSSQEELQRKANWIENNKSFDLDKSEKEDLEYIKNNDLITAYRGFLVKDNDTVRVLDKQSVLDHGNSKEERFYGSLYYYLQNEGFGISYTLDKFVALYFAFHAERSLQKINKHHDKVRCCVGQYQIRTSDIFTYTDARHEREITLRQYERKTKTDVMPFIQRYEFFTNGEGKFDRTGGYYQGDETRPTMLKYDYANDRKIMNTFRKVA